MKKEAFKNFVKEKIKMSAFGYLMKLKEKHSKMDNLNYAKINLQPYFKSNFYRQEVQNLFKFRTRMAKVKNNFRNGNEDNICPFQSCDNIDDQKHLLTCSAININTSTEVEEYLDIFSDDPKKARTTIRVLMSTMEKRDKLLNQVEVTIL